jgi:hypothetical protein
MPQCAGTRGRRLAENLLPVRAAPRLAQAAPRLVHVRSTLKLGPRRASRYPGAEPRPMNKGSLVDVARIHGALPPTIRAPPRRPPLGAVRSRYRFPWAIAMFCLAVLVGHAPAAQRAA